MRKILILDDDPRVCEELGEFLSRKHFTVYSAVKPSSAFSILNREQIEIVFLDFTLPEMDGLQILTKINQEHPNVKTIMISGNSDLNIVNEAKRNGAVDFIHKPFLPKDVNQALNH